MAIEKFMENMAAWDGGVKDCSWRTALTPDTGSFFLSVLIEDKYSGIHRVFRHILVAGFLFISYYLGSI